MHIEFSRSRLDGKDSGYMIIDVLAVSGMGQKIVPLQSELSWLTFYADNLTLLGQTEDVEYLGTYALVLRVSDGYEYSDYSFTLSLTNRAPAASASTLLPTLVCQLGKPVGYTINRSVVADEDNDTIHFEAKVYYKDKDQNLENVLPWLSFDRVDLTLTGSTNSLQYSNQIYTIKVYFYDKYMQDIYLTPPLYFLLVMENRPPRHMKGIPDQEAYIGDYFAYTVPADTCADENAN